MASSWACHILAIYLRDAAQLRLNYGSTVCDYRFAMLLQLPPRVERRQFGGNAGPVHKFTAPKYFPSISQALPKFYPSQKGLGELGYYLGTTWVVLGYASRFTLCDAPSASSACGTHAILVTPHQAPAAVWGMRIQRVCQRAEGTQRSLIGKVENICNLPSTVYHRFIR